MKKALLGLLTVVVLAIAGGAVWFYNSLDSLVKTAIEKYVPEMTQSTVRVATVKISLTDGAGRLEGLHIGNPKGFKTPHALSAAAVELAVDPATVTGAVTTLKRIAVLAPDINYETADAGSNFDVIQRNVDAYVVKLVGKSDPNRKSPERKFIVEALSIRDAKVSYAPALLQGKSITVPLPNIELRNVGKAKGGITSAELAAEIVAALKASISRAVTQPIKGAAEAVGNAARSAGETVKGLFK